MKKTMIVFAATFMFASCGNVGTSTQVTTDTTGVKCDTCQTDTTTVVADPLPPNPPADVEPGVSTEPTTYPVLTVDPRDPKPQPLPNPKPKGQKS